MTATQLKKDLQAGKTLTMIYNSMASSSKTITARLNKPRYIIKVQTNGLTLAEDPSATRGSFLELPPASLIDYDGKTLTFYRPALRNLTPDESAILAGEPSCQSENAVLAERDALTDGSQTFWLDKAYYNKHDANWRWSWDKGKRYDISERKMWDKKIKGEKDLQYIIN